MFFFLKYQVQKKVQLPDKRTLVISKGRRGGKKTTTLFIYIHTHPHKVSKILGRHSSLC